MAGVEFLKNLMEATDSDILFWDLREWAPQKRCDGPGYDLVPVREKQSARNNVRRMRMKT